MSKNTNIHEQYVYALTCGTSCHQCVLWMIRSHSYTRCGSFCVMLQAMRFASPSKDKARVGRDSRHGHEMYKHIWHRSRLLLLRRTSSTSCTCIVVKTPEAAIQSVCPQTYNSPSHCKHTTARVGHVLRQVEKNSWYVKCSKMYYSLTMVMYTRHCKSSQVQIHRHSGDQGINLSIIGTFS